MFGKEGNPPQNGESTDKDQITFPDNQGEIEKDELEKILDRIEKGESVDQPKSGN